MIIKDKALPVFLLRWCFALLSWFLKKRFNKLLISKIEIKPGHSYLLMCNHFSFWDGFLAAYLSYQTINKQAEMKGFKVMVLKKQIEMNPWLRYFGCFSVEPGKASIEESLTYAAEILNTPGNILLMYPQGNLESCHVRHIVFKEGISEIVPKIEGNCQLLWSSNITEYFESLKPSVYFDLLDCGSNHDFNFDVLKENVNRHHQTAIKNTIRFTREP